MDLSSSDISSLVFRRIQKTDSESISFDSQTLMLLVELDGKKTLGQIAQQTRLKMHNIREIISRLVQLKLAEQVAQTISSLSSDFFNYLQVQLSLAIGPVADILIQDAVKDLGFTQTAFPKSQAPELVETLSRDIQETQERAVFTQNIINRLKSE